MRNSLKVLSFIALCGVTASACAHRLGTASFVQPLDEVNMRPPDHYQLASSYDVAAAQGVNTKNGVLTLYGLTGSYKAFSYTIPYSKIDYRKHSSNESNPQNFAQMCPNKALVFVTPIALTSSIDQTFTKPFIFGIPITFRDNCTLGTFAVNGTIQDNPDQHSITVTLNAFNKEANLNPQYNDLPNFAGYMNNRNYCEDTAKALGTLNMKVQFTVQC